jgi:histone H3/H4
MYGSQHHALCELESIIRIEDERKRTNEFREWEARRLRKAGVSRIVRESEQKRCHVDLKKFYVEEIKTILADEFKKVISVSEKRRDDGMEYQAEVVLLGLCDR